jgi:eukaryotic-like serine/threonine-protein kinase
MLCIRCKNEIDKNFRACPHCGESVTDFTRKYTDDLLDGKYKILERLGAGGMGDVYKAEHTYLGATRVIKVIRPHISESKDAHDRFLREARVATRVQHQNVATLHDFSALADGSHYMVWEYIDGENLAQRLRARTTLPPRAAVRIAIQALHGLEAVHRAGIVHRDISPENLMITRENDSVKIIDLGVAKIDDPSEVAATRTGIFVGKLRYASPEQLGFLGENERLDSRADIYAMGMVLYEMLAGRPPFEATSPHQFYLHHSEEKEFQPVDLPADLPGGADLQAALRKALQRDRTKRFQSAKEFATALEEVEKSLPDPGAMRTMALAFDADETMKVRDTLHRSTVRTEITAPSPHIAPAPPPPPPAPAPRPPAAATEVTSMPQSRPPRQGISPAIVIAVFLILISLVAAAAWWFTRGRGDKPPLIAEGPGTTTTAPVANPGTIAPPAPVPSATTLDVTTTTATPVTTTTAPPVLAAPLPRTTTVAPIPTTTTQQPAPPVTTTTAAPVERPTPPVERAERDEPREDTGDNTYIVRGDEDANEKVIERLRGSLKGTRRVAVRGGEMQSELVNAINDEFPFLEITDSANVVIDFDGRLEELPRGRKARTARATIRKNGRVVFRYILQREMYRVGNTPAEAFVAAVADAFEE